MTFGGLENFQSFILQSAKFQSVIFQSVIFQSIIFHPWDFVCHFPVLQFPVLQIQLSHDLRRSDARLWYSRICAELKGRWKPNSITLAGSKLVADRFEVKFHYAIWFEPASNQPRTSFEPDSVLEFGREPASSCLFAANKLDDRPNFSANQLGTSSEPASVMEFGLKLQPTNAETLQLTDLCRWAVSTQASERQGCWVARGEARGWRTPSCYRRGRRQLDDWLLHGRSTVVDWHLDLDLHRQRRRLTTSEQPVTARALSPDQIGKKTLAPSDISHTGQWPLRTLTPPQNFTWRTIAPTFKATKSVLN